MVCRVTVKDINKFKNYWLIQSTMSAEDILQDADTIEDLINKRYLNKIMSSDYDIKTKGDFNMDYNVDFYKKILET